MAGRYPHPVDNGRPRRLGVAAAVVDGEVVAGDVAVDGGLIAEVGLSPAGTGLAHPGLVDLQVNGYAGSDFRTAAPGALVVAAEELAAGGATAFQPTLHSAAVPTYCDALRRIDEARRSTADLRDAGGPAGARILGAHLEGPFLTARWAGAHDPALLMPVDLAVATQLLDAGSVAMMTLAPELDGAVSLIEMLGLRSVTAAIGHSDADAETVRNAIDRGATHLTHCWNAHRRLGARDPGPAGVALSDQRTTIGLIADLVHVAPEVVRLTFAAAPGRIAVTTDAVVGAARAGESDEVLRGGASSPAEILGRLRSLGFGWDVTSSACSGVPARLAGLSERLLQPGTVADIVVLDDRLDVVRVVVAGTEVARGA